MFEKHVTLSDTLYLFATTFDLSVIIVIIAALVIVYRYRNTPYFASRSIYCINTHIAIVCICLIPTRVINILFHFNIININNIDHEKEHSSVFSTITINNVNKTLEIIKFGIFIPALLNCVLLNTILYRNQLNKLSSILPKTKDKGKAKKKHVHKQILNNNQISSTGESPAPALAPAPTLTATQQAGLAPKKRGRSRHRGDDNININTSDRPGSKKRKRRCTFT